MTNIPKIHIGYNSHGYALAGWEEFNRYALVNWPLWKETSYRPIHAGSTDHLTEVDRLKLMLAAHALEVEHLKKVYADYVSENPPTTMTGPNGEVYRYVGP